MATFKYNGPQGFGQPSGTITLKIPTTSGFSFIRDVEPGITTFALTDPKSLEFVRTRKDLSGKLLYTEIA